MLANKRTYVRLSVNRAALGAVNLDAIACRSVSGRFIFALAERTGAGHYHRTYVHLPNKSEIRVSCSPGVYARKDFGRERQHLDPR
jgi:hypothetical protein